jgi:hypothetical protein
MQHVTNHPLLTKARQVSPGHKLTLGPNPSKGRQMTPLSTNIPINPHIRGK